MVQPQEPIDLILPDNQFDNLPTDQQRQEIRELQSYLRYLSLEYPEIPRISITGILDEETVDAIKAFQRVMGLPQTGLLDFETNYLLNRSYYETQQKNSPPRLVQVFPDKTYVILPGEESFLVAQIQLFLSLLQEYFVNFESQPLNGVYDEPTVANIKEIQRISSLPTTGEMDKSTWNALALLYNNILHPGLLRQNSINGGNG